MIAERDRGRGSAIGRATAQHKATIAITAIDIAALINLHIYKWMAKRCRAISFASTNGACPVARDAARVDFDDLGNLGAHDLAGVV